MIKTRDDIRKLGTILGIWAHPDDETFSMAGIMAVAAANDQTVIIITATRGEQGVQDESRWPQAQLADIRTRECEEAFKILGIKNHHWLDYPDGGCTELPQREAIERVAGYIRRYDPDTILTFGPDGMTGHPDHQTISRWATAAAALAKTRAKIYHAIQTFEQYEGLVEIDKKFNIFWNIDKPAVCETGQCAIHFELDDDIYEKKLAALRAMASQQEGMMKLFGDSLHLSFGHEAFTEKRADVK